VRVQLEAPISAAVQVTHPLYQPHLTLAYINKGTHKELDGHQYFKNKNFSVSSLLYSSPERTMRKNINLV